MGKLPKRKITYFLLILNLLFVLCIAPQFLALIKNNSADFAESIDSFTSSTANNFFPSAAKSNDDNDSNFKTWRESEHNRRQAKIAISKEIIPDWMTDYLVWHREQREKLRNHNNNNNSNTTGAGDDDDDIKFLVVRCVEGEKCGGLSDRLKPMPFYLMMANLAHRVLLIHWKKPCHLEHFLVPPPTNGLDWRVDGTGVTINEIRDNTTFFNGHADSLSLTVRELIGVKPGREDFVQAKVLNVLLDGGQRIYEGMKLFNRWRNEPGQRLAHANAYLGWSKNATDAGLVDHDLFQDVYRILFEPSPEIQREIYAKMSNLDLLGREFNAAQVRAKHPQIIPDDVALEWIHHQARAAQQPQSSSPTDSDKYIHPYELKQQKKKMDMTEKFVYGEKMKSFLVRLYSNAVACADGLTPGRHLPIYLASDTSFGEYMQNISTLPIRASSSSSSFSTSTWGNGTTHADPLHIDADANQGRDPSLFYQAFVDVYIMANATCLSYSGMGFGFFPIRMGEVNCSLTHANMVCVDPLRTVENGTSGVSDK